MKTKRFIIEYANYRMTELEKNSLMQEKIKLEKMRKITRTVYCCKNGMITINETMRILSEI